MRFTSHLFLRVEPAMPVAIAAAAKARGIGASEFIRRAVIQALEGGVFRVENRKRRSRPRALRLVTGAPDGDPPSRRSGRAPADDAGGGLMPGEADTPTLGQILGEAEMPADPALADPLSVQRSVALRLGAASVGAVAARTVYSVDDGFGQVLEWVRESTGRQIGSLPTWLRIWRPDLGRGVLFVVCAPRVPDEAELIVVGQRGALSRSVLKAACRAFVVLGLRRLVMRVPVDRPDLADLCRRAGAGHEGVARDGLGDGLDAGMWTMTVRSCRWLLHAPSPIPTRDLGPRHSSQVH